MSSQKIRVDIVGDNKKLKSSLKESEGAMDKFGNQVKKIGGILAGAFAVDRLIDFGKESVKLAAEMDGVSKAFERIGNERLLNDLRQATKGAVSDLNLMKKAVMASNFQIPLDQLASLLEFASKRAQDTGQSIDYLVDSIVKGLGRKSPLILDNLNITTLQLQEKLGDTALTAASIGELTAAAAKIAQEEMSKSGEIVDTTGLKLQQLGATWDNLKVNVGEGLSGPLSKALSILSDAALQASNYDLNLKRATKLTADEQERLFDLYLKMSNEAGRGVQGLVEKYKDLGGELGESAINADEVKKGFEDIGFSGEHVNIMYEQLIKHLRDNNYLYDAGAELLKRAAADRAAEAKAIEDQAKALESLRLAQELTEVFKGDPSGDYDSLAGALINLEDQRDSIVVAARKHTIATREQADATEMLNQKMAEKNAIMEEGFKQDPQVSASFQNYLDLTAQLEKQIVSLAASVAGDLAFAFGEAAGGMDTLGDSIADLGIMIASALGDILIAAGIGLGITGAGLGLVLAGLTLKVGAGLTSGIMQNQGDVIRPQNTNAGGAGNSMLYGNDIRTSYDYAASNKNRVG